MSDLYNELLVKGLTILKELEFDNIPEEYEIEHAFSSRYIKNKEALLNKFNSTYWKYINTFAKKIAIVIITLIIALSSIMTVDSIRETIIDFIVRVYNQFTTIDSHNQSQNPILERYYTLNEQPAEYKLTSTNISEFIFVMFWNSQNNEIIMLKQIGASESDKFNSEYGELREDFVNNTPCLICKTNTDYFCYWEFDSYRFELVYPLALGEEFMSKVVGNLVEVDPEDLTTE